MRNFEEEQLQKECLLQQKRNELEECKNSLQEIMNKAVKLHNEAEKDKESISKLWYKLKNNFYIMCFEINVTGKSGCFF